METVDRNRRTTLGRLLGGLALLWVAGFNPIQCDGFTPRAASSGEGVSQSPEPTRLLTTSGSAYAATLAPDDEGSYLLTANSAYRLVLGQTPEQHFLELGNSPTLMNHRLLYWSRGAFRRVLNGDSDTEIVAEYPRQPQQVVTSKERFAWLDMAEGGRHTIQTLDGSTARVLYEAGGYVNALVMQEESIYFVEQGPGKGWRLGLLQLDGGAPRFTATRTGRTPALLVASGDLFYYDGTDFVVRRVSPDLLREDVVAHDVICSTIAVAQHVYCAKPDGLLEVGRDGVVRKTVLLKQKGMITAIAATQSRLTWVVDVGPNQLAVETIALSGSQSAT